jgi:hypothetical protein
MPEGILINKQQLTKINSTMKKVIPFILLLASLNSIAQDYKSFPMWNTALPFEKRVNDVVSRLTLEEKWARCLMLLRLFQG